ncbi:MAG: IS481 family transposase [Bdellovibrionia bacterium]
MNERMHFVTRLEAGDRMTDLCREYGISRKTGYKFWERYRKLGPKGLFDESKKPFRHPQQISEEAKKLVLDLKREKPTWGPRKIFEQLSRRHPGVRIPSRPTIYLLLDRNGLVKKRGHRRTLKASGTRITLALAPNELWCADFKGEFRLGNREYCYPLTITDHFSRYLLGVEALENTKALPAHGVFESVFRQYGLPKAILSDNGSPFGSVGLFGWSRLSLWLMRLGIEIQRIEPGHPEQNGRHERMHLTLKQETTRPSGQTILQQQEKFDKFRDDFNTDRPHEGLGMKYPAQIYSASPRPFPEELSIPEYPLHDLTKTVLAGGFIQIGRFRGKVERFHLGQAFIGQRVGLREEESGLWRVSFLKYDLGFYDSDKKRFQPFECPVLTDG